MLTRNTCGTQLSTPTTGGVRTQTKEIIENKNARRPAAHNRLSLVYRVGDKGNRTVMQCSLEVKVCLAHESGRGEVAKVAHEY